MVMVMVMMVEMMAWALSLWVLLVKMHDACWVDHDDEGGRFMVILVLLMVMVVLMCCGCWF